MNPEWSAFATCPKGLESLLLDELCAHGASNPKATVAGVAFDAELTTLYRVCLWSRLANRVLLRLSTFEFDSAATLYEGAKSIAWPEHFAIDSTFAIDSSGTGATAGDRVIGRVVTGAVFGINSYERAGSIEASSARCAGTSRST